MSALPLMLALLRAIPAVEQLVRVALQERDKERERAAARRHVEKDAAVDAALANPPRPTSRPFPPE